MNLTDEQVIHETFGVGQVLENDNERITVMFAQNVGRKVFVFPDAFGNHLKMRKQEIQDKLYQAYETKQEEQKQQRAVLKQEREDEAARLAEEQAKPKKTVRKRAAKKS